MLKEETLPPQVVASVGEDNLRRLRRTSLSPEQFKSIQFVSGGDTKKMAFLRNVLLIENRGNKSIGNRARSGAGALGAFQFIPSTAKSFGLDPEDRTNFHAAARAAGRYFDHLYQRFDGNMLAMYADYNGGTKASTAVMKGQWPPKKETRDYINMARALHMTY